MWLADRRRRIPRPPDGPPPACILCDRDLPHEADQDPRGARIDYCSPYALDSDDTNTALDPYSPNTTRRIMYPELTLQDLLRQHRRAVRLGINPRREEPSLDSFTRRERGEATP